MHKLITIFVSLLLLISSVVAQTPPTWLRLSPAGAGFSVMLPGKAEEQTVNNDRYSATLYKLTTKDGLSPRVIYLVRVGEYTSTVKVDPQVKLPADRDSFIKGLPGMKLIESHDVTLDGRSGIELTGESDTTTVTARFYVKGNQVYQLAALVYKGIDEKENVMRFFDSFAFVD
jgi:hypothetical protein